MTNKEAKHILELYASLIELDLPDDILILFGQAYELAIKALEERPQTIGCFNCKHDYKRMTEEPCKYCNEKFSEWQVEGGRE